MKKTISILLSAMFLIASCSCAKKEETTTALASETKTSETTTEVETTTEMETTTTEPPVPTEHIDNVGDVKIIDHKAPTNNELTAFRAYTCKYFVGLGMDNPYLLKDAHYYFNNPTATIEEFNYLQPENMNECENNGTVYGELYDMTNYYDFNLVRYVLSEENLRFMIDEIPYSFFEKYFPDYLMYYDMGSSPDEYILGGNNLIIEFDDGMNDSAFLSSILQEDSDQSKETMRLHILGYYLFNTCSNNNSAFLSSVLQEDSDLAKETMRFYIFDYLKQYNSQRYRIATLNSDLIGFIPIARSVDGRNVLAPTRFRYSQLQSEVNKFPRCENIDISTPETYEDLVNSGVDVELMEEVFHYSGIDIPSLSQGENTTKNSTETEMETQTT